MPYVKQERRPDLDEVVEALNDRDVEANGDLNYILFKFCKFCIPQSYNSLKNFCGELRQCATEIERRLLTPYEDGKIQENGDVK